MRSRPDRPERPAAGGAGAAALADAERLLDAAALEAGDTVLALGAGLELLMLAAQGRIGDGWLIAVTPSAAALEGLLRAAHEAEASGIKYLVGDAEVLPLPDASVDAVIAWSALARAGGMEAAAWELARVLRRRGRLSLREPLRHDAASLATAIDWSPLGELGERVRALSPDAAPGADPALRRRDGDALISRLELAGFAELDAVTADAVDDWVFNEESLEACLDGAAAPDLLSPRRRWERAFAPHEIRALVAHLRSLAGATVTVRRPHLFLRARRA